VVVEDEVVAVSVELCADVLLLKDSEVEERPHVAALEAPVGAVTAQDSVTVPVNELAGVTVMVAVLPVVAPGVTVMLPLLVRLKLPPPPLGACQKSPQPARSVAAANNPAQRPIFISAPYMSRLPAAPSFRTRSQGIACRRFLSCSRQARDCPKPNIDVDAGRRMFA
jgi:hypothetical protein